LEVLARCLLEAYHVLDGIFTSSSESFTLQLTNGNIAGSSTVADIEHFVLFFDLNYFNK